MQIKKLKNRDQMEDHDILTFMIKNHDISFQLYLRMKFNKFKENSKFSIAYQYEGCI